MFDINFISEPGIQNEISDASWSFLQNQNEPDKQGESDSQQSKTASIKKNSWKNYIFVLAILGLITVISILNNRSTKVTPDLAVLNQVIDLIDGSDDITIPQLKKAIFSKDKAKVTIFSENFTEIQSFSKGYRMENKIPYEMYQKKNYSYIILIFPWKGNEKGGDITILQSVADKIVFSNNTFINLTEDIFEIQGQSSDIISFLLKMAENKQIHKFSFSVFHRDSGEFNLKVKLSLK